MNRVPIADRLVWTPVVRPQMPLIYLDLNNFIELARALIDPSTAQPGYLDLVGATRRAVREREACALPPSGEHLWEISAIKSPRQRRDVADVVEEISGFNHILGRAEIAHLARRQPASVTRRRVSLPQGRCLYRLASMGDRKRELSRASLKVLASFMREPGDAHYGLQLIADSGVKAGSLYPILQRFELDGWIEGVWEDVDPSREKRPRRRYYKLTGLGQQAAREELRRATSGLTVGALGWTS